MMDWVVIVLSHSQSKRVNGGVLSTSILSALGLISLINAKSNWHSKSQSNDSGINALVLLPFIYF